MPGPKKPVRRSNVAKANKGVKPEVSRANVRKTGVTKANRPKR